MQRILQEIMKKKYNTWNIREAWLMSRSSQQRNILKIVGFQVILRESL